ncbi:MAG: hypothetical protein JRH19_23155, partial [Deltaproteobacteria bacterium]|nr:hypothetical protein [Deltaproteobacteria bacterium]
PQQAIGRIKLQTVKVPAPAQGEDLTEDLPVEDLPQQDLTAEELPLEELAAEELPLEELAADLTAEGASASDTDDSDDLFDRDTQIDLSVSPDEEV